MITVQIPCISLSHLSSETRHGYLSSEYGDAADDLPFKFAPYDSGYFMTVPACAAEADDEQRAEFASMPADLRAIFKHMQECAPSAWFMLDVDGDAVNGLWRPRLIAEAHLLSDEFEREIKEQFGVTVLNRDHAPWRVVFEGSRTQLEAMYAEHWGSDAGKPEIID